MEVYLSFLAELTSMRGKIHRGRISYPGPPAGRISYEFNAYFLKHSNIVILFEKTAYPPSFPPRPLAPVLCRSFDKLRNRRFWRPTADGGGLGVTPSRPSGQPRQRRGSERQRLHRKRPAAMADLFRWRRADSNRCPNAAPGGFLHAYPSFGFCAAPAGWRAKTALAFES